MSLRNSRATAVALVTFATFTDIVAYSVAVPVLPDLSRRLGASPTMIGFLFASFGVTLLTVSIPMGAVSDRMGRKAPLVGVDDPWGWGRSLEWATSSPPPRHNFVQLPRIRSESPAFDLHHPEIAMSEYPTNGAVRDNLLDAGEDQGRVDQLAQVLQGDTGTDVDGEGKA